MTGGCAEARRTTSVQLGGQTVTVDLLDLDTDAQINIASALRTLNGAERARAEAFHFERHKDRFVRGRGYMRRTLADLVGSVDPADLDLVETANGKPALPGNGPWFNLSHSEGWAVLASSRTGPVGIDLERLDRSVDVGSLAATVFTGPECDVLAAALDADTRCDLFFRFWTAKEARMKLTGEGMSLDPKRIRLDLVRGSPTGFLGPATPPAALRYLSDLPGHCCAICVVDSSR